MLVASVVLHLVDILLDILLVGAWTDQQNILRIDNDIVAQTVDDGNLALWQRNYRRTSIVGVAAILGLNICISILA